ncbi:MAG: hypothetical protein NVS4B13_09790 [Candidatus Elarobacter sp.]
MLDGLAAGTDVGAVAPAPGALVAGDIGAMVAPEAGLDSGIGEAGLPVLIGIGEVWADAALEDARARATAASVSRLS